MDSATNGIGTRDARTSLGVFVIAAGCFSAAAFPPAPRSVAFSVAGLALLALGFRGRIRLRTPLAAFVAATISVIGAISSDIARIPEVSPLALLVWLVAPLTVAGLWLIRRRSERFLQFSSVLLAAIVIIVGLSVMITHQGSDTGVDVYFGHIEAAEALWSGQDPYGEAVRIFDGRPDQDGIIVGYSYPPATLVPYAAVQRLAGDARWLNLVAWIGIVAMVAWPAVRKSDEVAFATLIVLSSFGAWRLVVYTGWTEPLTIALLTIAALLWKRPVLSAVLLGLGLATKQYMILLAPILVFAIPTIGRRRVVTAVGVAGLTFVPSAVLGLDTMLEALVLRFLRAGYRADTLSLPALLDRIGREPIVPILPAVMLVGVLAWILRRRVSGGGQLLVVSATVLATFFVLTQALTNYWFLVAAMIALGEWLRWAAPPDEDTVHLPTAG